MKIITLIEDTAGAKNCAAAHGLSFYIETAHHRLLMDLGPGKDTLTNAEQLGIDLSAVDSVILSHGHYDHAGGILPFAALNPQALIYMQAAADGDFYADDGEAAGAMRYRYIGIDKAITALPRVRLLSGDTAIDDEAVLFTLPANPTAAPFANRRLRIKQGEAFLPDDFRHEQCLVLKENGKRTLLSGCAHSGILHILETFRQNYDGAPDAVISGFHLMKKHGYEEDDVQQIRRLAKHLTNYPTAFYTCHCTGTAAFDIMKVIMGEQLHYLHTGESITLT